MKDSVKNMAKLPKPVNFIDRLCQSNITHQRRNYINENVELKPVVEIKNALFEPIFALKAIVYMEVSTRNAKT